MSGTKPWAALLLAAFSVACATNPAPQGWLPAPAELPSWTRGVWIEAHLKKGPAVRGELIAVGSTHVHVLTEKGLQKVTRIELRRVDLAVHQTESGAGAGAVGGVLLSLSHGFWGVFTVWPWVGIAVAESRAPLLHASSMEVGAFLDTNRKYARFPQGLPEGLDPKSLGPLSPMIRTPRVEAVPDGPVEE